MIPLDRSDYFFSNILLMFSHFQAKLNALFVQELKKNQFLRVMKQASVLTQTSTEYTKPRKLKLGTYVSSFHGLDERLSTGVPATGDNPQRQQNTGIDTIMLITKGLNEYTVTHGDNFLEEFWFELTTLHLNRYTINIKIN